MRLAMEKDDEFPLNTINPNIDRILITVGTTKDYAEDEVVPDLCVYMVQDGEVCEQDDFLFYNFKKHATGSVYLEDCPSTLFKDCDRAGVVISLGALSKKFKRIEIIASIYDGAGEMKDFDNEDELFIRLVDLDAGIEITKIKIADMPEMVHTIHVADIVPKDGFWSFLVRMCSAGSLESLCAKYGIEVE